MFKLMQNVQKCQRKPPDVEEWGGIEVDQAVEGTGHLINVIHLVEDAGWGWSGAPDGGGHWTPEPEPRPQADSIGVSSA